MFCVKCGADIPNDSEFCTSCGGRIPSAAPEEKRGSPKGFWTRKKAVLLILASIIATSAFWVFVWGSDIVSTEDESVNIIVHLIETLGRQWSAWDKTEKTVDLILYGFSDECVSEPGCVDDTVDAVTILLTEVGKEREEIENLWSKEVLGQDIENYFSKLSDKNLNKILDVFNIHFPEEAEELEPSTELLYKR